MTVLTVLLDTHVHEQVASGGRRLRAEATVSCGEATVLCDEATVLCDAHSHQQFACGGRRLREEARVKNKALLAVSCDA